MTEWHQQKSTNPHPGPPHSNFHHKPLQSATPDRNSQGVCLRLGAFAASSLVYGGVSLNICEPNTAIDELRRKAGKSCQK